tara:strand:- start:10880 stop:11266 length:387 start_codon:yes stop_codon:yes gene_type:complete
MIHYLDTNVYKHQDEWFEQAAKIYMTLPKNTEWFGDWEITQTNESLRFSGKYFISEHTENPQDVIDFTVIFFKDAEKLFKLQFNGVRSQRLAKKYYIRGYLENEVVESIYGLGGNPDFIYSLSLCDMW